MVCASEIGITKLRVTGGEPLMRKGILPFIKRLSQIEGIKDISITTNAVLLESQIDEIVKSGVNRINISLDTLKPERFKFISGRDHFETVWRGILAALDRGLSPIKLNAVILRGVNDDEIEALAGLSLKYPFHVRFIEYMPMGNSEVDISQQVLVPEIKNIIERSMGTLEPVGQNVNNTNKQNDNMTDKSNHIDSGRFITNEAGPAKRYKINGALGEIGFISPVSSHFCHQCNRLRLTSTGHLRPCLLNNSEIDLLTPLREGASNNTIKHIFISAIKGKPAAHSLNSTNGVDNDNLNENNFTNGVEVGGDRHVDTQMSTIGG